MVVKGMVEIAGRCFPTIWHEVGTFPTQADHYYVIPFESGLFAAIGTWDDEEGNGELLTDWQHDNCTLPYENCEVTLSWIAPSCSLDTLAMILELWSRWSIEDARRWKRTGEEQ